MLINKLQSKTEFSRLVHLKSNLKNLFILYWSIAN